MSANRWRAVLAGVLFAPAVLYVPYQVVSYEYSYQPAPPRGEPSTPRRPAVVEVPIHTPVGYGWAWEAPTKPYRVPLGSRYDFGVDTDKLLSQCGGWLAVVVWFVSGRPGLAAAARGGARLGAVPWGRGLVAVLLVPAVLYVPYEGVKYPAGPADPGPRHQADVGEATARVPLGYFWAWAPPPDYPYTDPAGCRWECEDDLGPLALQVAAWVALVGCVAVWRLPRADAPAGDGC